MKILILIFYFTFNVVLAQTQNANEILKKVKSNIDIVNDYVVDVKGVIDFPDAVIPDIEAKIYFKKPDKLKVKSEHFMVLPKQTIRFSPELLFKDDITAIFSGEVEIDRIKHFIIKIIPNNPEEEEIVTLWINSKNFTIRKINAIDAKSGKIELELHNKLIENKYWVPEKIIVNFEVKSLRFMRFRRMEKELKQNVDAKREGTITLYYSNYQINKGVDDSIFIDSKK